MQALTCPKCAGAISWNGVSSIGDCPFCGVSVVLNEETMRRQGNVQRGYIFMMLEEYEPARKAFEQAIEENPGDHGGWLGMVYYSSLSAEQDISKYITNAMKTVTDKQRSEVKQEIQIHLNRYVTDLEAQNKGFLDACDEENRRLDAFVFARHLTPGERLQRRTYIGTKALRKKPWLFVLPVITIGAAFFGLFRMANYTGEPSGLDFLGVFSLLATPAILLFCVIFAIVFNQKARKEYGMELQQQAFARFVNQDGGMDSLQRLYMDITTKLTDIAKIMKQFGLEGAEQVSELMQKASQAKQELLNRIPDKSIDQKVG